MYLLSISMHNMVHTLFHTLKSYIRHSRVVPVHDIETKGPFCLQRAPVKQSSTSADRQPALAPQLVRKELSRQVTSTGPRSTPAHLARPPAGQGHRRCSCPQMLFTWEKDRVHQEALLISAGSVWQMLWLWLQHTTKPFWNADLVLPVESWNIWSFC